MTLTIKDSHNLANSDKPGVPSQSSESKANESPRSNPVCLEVAVTVRKLPGESGDARGSALPVREQGRTVIVFDNGAVLRLSNNLPAGQKIIVSNAQGRDVVCRVVMGRNLPSVKGYLEVEFMEQVSDFWCIHQSAGPTGIAEIAKFSAPIPVAAVSVPAATLPTAAPAQATPPAAPTTIVPPPAPPVTQRVATPEKELPSQSDNAPSFDDIVGLVKMSRTSAVPVKASVPPASAKALTSKSEVENGQSESEFSSTISGPNPTSFSKPIPNVASVNRTAPSAQEFSPQPVQKRSPSNVFMAGGILAGGQNSSVSSPAESRRRMPMILASAALLLAGLGGGYFYLHRGIAPALEAPATLAAQPSAPVSSAQPSDPLGQVATSQAAAAETLPSQPQSVSTVAAESQEERVSAPAESPQNLRQGAANAQANLPDRPTKKRQEIPGLKMKSPSAPKQTLAKLSDGSAPSITDASSAMAVGGAPGATVLAPVVRSENQPAPPALLGAAGPSAKAIREPRLIATTRPVYPAVARQANTQGTVVVSAQVDANGRITDVKAISGPASLRQAAIDSVKQWKYSPALIDGRPAAAEVTVDVQFRLN